MSSTQSPSVLSVEDVEVVYDQAVVALRGVSLQVPTGQVVALLGANGAGKTTLLRAISNLVRAARGRLTRGKIVYQGQEIQQRDAAHVVAAGLAQVLEGRHCFRHLTVEENLQMGALPLGARRATLAAELDRIYGLFPRLRERRDSKAGYTSGGEQQMVAIGRALMAHPRLLLLDEPSMGLAPKIVEEIFEILRALNRKEGLSVLLAEQNAVLALPYADWGYLMENGKVSRGGPAADLLADDQVIAAYLGGTQTNNTTARRGRDRPRRPEFALSPQQ